MSVNRTTAANLERNERWDELEHQFITARLLVRSELLFEDSDDQEAQVEAWNSFEPTGGLARDQVAELVSLEATSYMIVEDFDDSFGDVVPTTVDTYLSADSQFEFATLNRESDPENEQGTDIGNSILSGNNDDPDTLQQFSASVGGVQSDDSNGVGLNLNDSVVSHVPMKNYRMNFGDMGPVYDRHDNFYFHSRFRTVFGSAGLDSAQLVHRTVLRMDWDVYTED